MKLFSVKKIAIAIVIAVLLFTGAYFVLGGFGYSGPEAAPNLDNYGLVGFWNMEEGTGQTISDRSGNGNNGTLGANSSVGKDDPVFTGGYSSAGPGGTALQFDGVDDYVGVPLVVSVASLSQYTITGWFKASSSISTERMLYGEGNTGNGNPLLLVKINNSNIAGQFRAAQSGDGGTVAGVTYTGGLNDDKWHYFTWVRRGASSFELFVDGISRGTSSTNPGTTTINNVKFGTVQDNTGLIKFFSGALDEVRIYNRALFADEIRQHYNQKKPILDLNFDEGSGQKAYDGSFNNNDGWLGGTSAVEASDPTWTTGKFGSALSFDGSNDYVDAGDIINTGNFTLSFWMKPSINYGSSSPATTIMSKYQDGNESMSVVFSYGTAGKIDFKLEVGGSASRYELETNTLSWEANRWYHITWVHSSALSNTKIYVNSINETNIRNSAGSQPNGLSFSATFKMGGGQNENYGTSYFNGLIDEPRVYNYARTQDEILADYNAGKAAHLGKDSQRDDGLVGYWNMEEGTGQTVYDHSGNGNNGTMGTNSSIGKDDPVFAGGYSSSGAGGTGLSFDGVDDYANQVYDTDFNFGTGSFSVGSWFKHNTISATDYLITRYSTSAGTPGGWKVYMDASGDIAFAIDDDATWNTADIATTSAIDYDNNIWHYFTAVKNGTLNIKLYIDGVEVASDSSLTETGTLSGTTPILYIGSDSPTAGSYWEGSLDEVRIYNRALSADEIRQHYNQKKPILDMKFDEGSGQTAYDGSFNNNDGTLGSTAGSDANDPTWTTGKEGSALSFGGNDYIVIADNNSLDFGTGNFTFESWVKTTQNCTGNKVYLSEYGSGNASIWLGCVPSGSEGKAYFSVRDSSSVSINSGNSTTTINDNNWHFLSGIKNGNNTYIYVDGKQENSGTGTFAGNLNFSNDAYIGRHAGSYYAIGLIDSVRIYNYARTQDEILANYNDGKAAHLGKDSQRDDGLVGYWNMEEGTGQTVYDHSGNGNNGTMGTNSSIGKDDPVFAGGYSSAGQGGTALSFDGKDDYVDSGTSSTLKLDFPVTVSAWVYFTNSSQTEKTLYTSDLTDNSYYGFWLGFNAGVFDMHYGTGGTTGSASRKSFATTNTFASGQWYHVVGIINGLSDMAIYVNGINQSGSYNGTGASYAKGSGSAGFGKKDRSQFESPYYFSGSIDEVRVYNRALSANEIRQHYNQKKPILDMKFDEGSGQKAYDESFNSNDGWLGGTSAIEASDPTWTTGKERSALSFDGGDYVTIGDPVSGILDPSNITVCAWAKRTGAGDGDSWQSIVQKQDWTNKQGYELFLEPENTAVAWRVLGSSNYYDISYNLTTSDWHYYCGSFDGSKSYLYVDGIQRNSASASMNTNNANPLIIGRDINLTNGRFEGFIDSVRIYNYTRTQDEIFTDYNNGMAAHLR